jgi:hypothetical protein
MHVLCRTVLLHTATPAYHSTSSGYVSALWQLAWERYRTHLTLSDYGKLYNAGSTVAAFNRLQLLLAANTQLLAGSWFHRCLGVLNGRLKY